MALAPFFDKTALAAAAVLQGFDRQQFASALEAQTVGVAFDDGAAMSREGRVTLELLVNLLARLYPTLLIVAQGDKASAYRADLERLARAVNPNISIAALHAPMRAGQNGDEHPNIGEASSARRPGALVVVGTTLLAQFHGAEGATPIYVGSHGWEARISTSQPVESGPTTLPFGAAAAACLGAANLFRFVFRSQLPSADLDAALTLSTVTLKSRTDAEPAGSPQLDNSIFDISTVDLGEVVLPGAGAVGQGAMWTLMRMPNLEGTVHVVDEEQVDTSNPQRYVLTAAADVGASKVALVEGLGSPHKDPARAGCPSAVDRDGPGVIVRRLPPDHARLEIVAHRMRWGAYLATRPQPWRLERVMVALDSARDRIAVQAALPHWIANAWTQPGDIGLSRHTGFGKACCLACLYLPTDSAKSEDVLVSEAVGLLGQHMRVRAILATNTPVDEGLLSQMAAGLGVPLEPLLSFVGRPLRAFYSEAVCGGVVLRLQSTQSMSRSSDGASLQASGMPADRAAMVPMAFQSVLAGVLLAAAVVADAAGLPAPPAGQKAVLDLLRPIPPRLLVPVARHASGKCLCQDDDYLAAYDKQWEPQAASPDVTDTVITPLSPVPNLQE